MKLYKQVDNKIELCILPKLEDEVRKIFNDEIEAGHTEVLEDGRLFFKFEVSAEKADLHNFLSRWIKQEKAGDIEIIEREKRNAS